MEELCVHCMVGLRSRPKIRKFDLRRSLKVSVHSIDLEEQEESSKKTQDQVTQNGILNIAG